MIPEELKAKTVELVRKAIQQRLQTWNTLNELEKLLNNDKGVDGLDQLIENYAIDIDESENVGQVDASNIVNEVDKLVTIVLKQSSEDKSKMAKRKPEKSIIIKYGVNVDELDMCGVCIIKHKLNGKKLKALQKSDDEVLFDTFEEARKYIIDHLREKRNNYKLALMIAKKLKDK